MRVLLHAARRSIVRGVAVQLVAVVVLASAVAPSSPISLAAFTGQFGVALTATADRLDPPPGVTCSSGLVICNATLVTRPQLAWSPSPDLYATGYEVWRSTTNGSGYVKVATAAGRLTTTWTDGGSVSVLTTYYYVVRAISPSWTSVSSNQVSVVVVLA